MGLPNLLNDVPRYDIKLPSASTEVKIRPFLVKEQKVITVEEKMFGKLLKMLLKKASLKKCQMI